MKVVEPEPLSVIDWLYDSTVPITYVMEYNRVLDVSPLVYRTNDPSRFKLALMWSLVLKTADKNRQILLYTAEDVFFLQVEGNDDKLRLENLLQNSLLRFSQEYDKRRTGTNLNYNFGYVNLDKQTDAVLLLLHPKEAADQTEP